MLAGIRTLELRKVYDSPSPMGAGAGGFAFTAPRAKGKTRQPKPQIVALEGISLDIAPGEIFCLLGPNGAGKSTTVGVLTTRIRPTSGRAFIGEHDVWLNQVAVKRLIGVVAQRPNLDFSLTAREILAFHGAYFGLSSHERAKRAEVLLERFKLTDRADQLVRGFSGGMMQRLSIARAMMHDPQVLFLDEPSAGLDPQTRLLLWEIIRDYNRLGKTIVLTTHYMDEADELWRGRLAAGAAMGSGSPAAFGRSAPSKRVISVSIGRRPPLLHPVEMINIEQPESPIWRKIADRVENMAAVFRKGPPSCAIGTGVTH